MPSPLRIGLITDVHYADIDATEIRGYRDGLSKVREAAALFRERNVSLALELGDFTDRAADVEAKIAGVRAIAAALAESGAECRHVVGNQLPRYVEAKRSTSPPSEKKPRSTPSTAQAITSSSSDGCFRGDGRPYTRGDFDWTDAHIPADQLCWLAADLARRCFRPHGRLPPPAPRLCPAARASPTPSTSAKSSKAPAASAPSFKATTTTGRTRKSRVSTT